MRAYLDRHERPELWKRVSAYAEKKMEAARLAMMRQSARKKARVVAEVHQRVLVPIEKNVSSMNH